MWYIIPSDSVREDPHGSSSKAWGLVLEDPCGFIIPSWFSFRGFIWFLHSRYDLVQEDPLGLSSQIPFGQEDSCGPSSQMVWYGRIHVVHHPRLGVWFYRGFIIPGWFVFRGFIWLLHSRYDLIQEDPRGSSQGCQMAVAMAE